MNNVDTHAWGKYYIDFLTGTIMRLDEDEGLASIFKQKMPDLYGVTSVSIRFNKTDIHENSKEVTIMEVI